MSYVPLFWRKSGNWLKNLRCKCFQSISSSHGGGEAIFVPQFDL